MQPKNTWALHWSGVYAHYRRFTKSKRCIPCIEHRHSSTYRFDGQGNFFNKDWDLSEGEGGEFCWYHVELPRSNKRLAVAAQYLIDVLCPPLRLQDILSLMSSGPFCGNVDGAPVFRVNSPSPTVSKCTQMLSAKINKNTVITVSLGKVPRLGFSPMG